MKHLIIGGVAGGATAAARIRRADERADIILIEKGAYISYANCGLPYYIGGVIQDRSKLFLQTPESFGHRFRIDVRVQQEAILIDPLHKRVRIRKADGIEYDESYDKLLLSPGAKAFVPPLPGIDLDGIFTLRNVSDTDRIKSYLESHSVSSAVVIGAGFIGLEMAENLHASGASVSIVEMDHQVMGPVDYSIASPLQEHLLQKGVRIYLDTLVTRFERQNDRIVIYFKDGRSIESDLVILSIGVRPETQLAVASGIELGESGGIKVDAYLETSAKDVYAVGDAIEFPHPLSHQPWMNYLANPANRQGRLVADTMVYGPSVAYEGAIGTAIAKVFDLTVAMTGLSAKRLKQLGIPYQSSTTHSASHAGYYPHASPLTIKLMFDPQSAVLYGAQCIGSDGVDKRIDQIALLIKLGGTVHDLTKIEHAYAPPFSSAKDPIAIAGYVASNIVSGAMPVISWRELQSMAESDLILLDVRTAEEHALEAIEGSINIPLDELRERMNELPKDKAMVIYCAIGLRGYLAINILKANGFKRIRNLSGGYKTFSSVLKTRQALTGSDQDEKDDTTSKVLP